MTCTPMNACLHLASHAGTLHDLAPATHANGPPLQVQHPHRPLHALKHAIHNVVNSREARGLQTVPTPNPHATNTCAAYAQAASPRCLQWPLWRSWRWRPRSKSLSWLSLQTMPVAAAGWCGFHCGRRRGARRRLDAVAASLAARSAGVACAMTLWPAARPLVSVGARRSLNAWVREARVPKGAPTCFVRRSAGSENRPY